MTTYKKQVLTICVLLCFSGQINGQTTQNALPSKTSDISFSPSQLTLVRLTEIYSTVEIQEIILDEPKIMYLDYLYSRSFLVAPNQEFSEQDWLKIEISNFKEAFQQSNRTEVLDENSGIRLILKSIDEIENETQFLRSKLIPEPTNSRLNPNN